jgi:hemolysin D
MEESIWDEGRRPSMILARPPRWARAMVYLLVSLCAAAVVWAYLARVDVHITARGIVRPRGGAFRVEAPQGGRLLDVVNQGALLAGDNVRKGQILFRIDTGQVASEREKAEAELASIRARIELLGAWKSNLERKSALLEERHDIEMQEAKLEFEKAEKGQNQAGDASATSESVLIYSKDYCDRIENMYMGNNKEEATGTPETLGVLASKIEYMRAKIDLLTAEGNRKTAKNSEDLAKSDVEISKIRIAMTQGRIDVEKEEDLIARREIDARVLELDGEEKALVAECARLCALEEEHRIKAPFDGVIASVSSRAGEIVSPGDLLAVLVPTGPEVGEQETGGWIIEAYVPNRDVGALLDPKKMREPASVRIKFDAYPYRDYEAVDGTLESVSVDSEWHDEVGWAFRIEVRPTKWVLKNGGVVRLGMQATVEIVKEAEQRVLGLLFKNFRDLVTSD